MAKFRSIIGVFLLTVLAAANLVASPPATTAPGKQEQQHFRWKDRKIKIAISSSLIKQSSNIKTDSDVVGAIRRSLQAWENVADIEFQIENVDKLSVSPSGSTGDGVSLITVAQSAENILFFGSDSQSVSAKTRVFYSRRGFISEADIVLNPFQQFSTDGTFGTFDLQSTLTHEIGHLLGLRHSSVMGAVMSENLAKVGALGFVDLGTRVLSESDVTAVRELYGTGDEKDDCCASISGKLAIPIGKVLKNPRVWAEDAATGRVVGQTDVAADGHYRIGGLSAGTYNLYWKAKTGSTSSATGELGSVEAKTGEALTFNQKVSVGSASLALDLFGVNSQLGESGVSLESGREQMIYLGGKGLDPKSVEIEFASPFLHVVPSTMVSQDFGDEISVISLFIKVDPDTPSGVYSIFAKSEDGSRSAVVGVIKVN